MKMKTKIKREKETYQNEIKSNQIKLKENGWKTL